MRDFRTLEVWQKGMELVEIVYCLTEQFPKHELYSITQQIQRSAVSIPSNIAEGCSRESKKEFIRYLSIAIGSSFELETQLIIAKRRKYIINNDEALFELLNMIQRKLNAFIKSLS